MTLTELAYYSLSSQLQLVCSSYAITTISKQNYTGWWRMASLSHTVVSGVRHCRDSYDHDARFSRPPIDCSSPSLYFPSSPAVDFYSDTVIEGVSLADSRQLPTDRA